MMLVVQTNVPGRLGVWAIDDSGQVRAQVLRTVRYHGSEQLLSLVDQVLRTARIQPRRLSRLVVIRGPGPFTAVRTGLVVANTLGWLWRIPVRGIVRNEFLQPKDMLALVKRSQQYRFQLARPWYGREPNITLPARPRWV